jgi:transposase-like protein
MNRSRTSEAEIIRILGDVEAGRQTIQAISRTYNITEDTYNRWLYTYGRMTPSARLNRLEEENSHLKRLLEERDQELKATKATLAQFL